MRRLALAAAIAGWASAPWSLAQKQAPATYSVTESNSMMMRNMTIQAVRDGEREMIDKTYPPIAANPKGYHSRAYYDFKTHQAYQLDLLFPGPCSAAAYPSSSAPWFDDPFSDGAENPLHSLPPKAARVGTAVIAGLTADELQAPDSDDPSAMVRIWIARQPRAVVKMQSVDRKGTALTMMEVQRVSFAKPDASLLALPASCQASQDETNTHGGPVGGSGAVGGKK
ncbi:MAG: hypothetical protein ACYCSN_14790 [Acidobacteriaceae bacterium]